MLRASPEKATHLKSVEPSPSEVHGQSPDDVETDTDDVPVKTAVQKPILKRKMNTMVTVLSRRSAFETRKIIRETWASGHVNVFFAVGACCPIPPSDRKKWLCIRSKATSIEDQTKWDTDCAKEDLKIAEEEQTYMDIIRMPDIDVYRHLPQKVKFAYTWGLEHTTAKWFLKTDDDSVVRVDTLDQYLTDTYDASGVVVIGKIINHGRVPRGGKWAEPHYKPSVYPKFPIGSVGHVVSRPVASYIAENSDKLFNYQGEDVSIGIWLDESPLKSKVKWVTSNHMTNSGNCKDKGKWVMGHNIKPATMRACFAHKDEIVNHEQRFVGVELKGGLGNNLFQLASVIGVAKRNKASPCYTGTNKADDFVEMRVAKCPGGHFATQKERGYARFTPFDIRQSTKISEYLQSYKYFADMPPFVVKPSMRTFARAYIRSHSNAKTNVGIHVRRGDHLRYGYLRFPSSQYFENAMEYFRNKYQDVQFFVASDDIAWCQKQSMFTKAHLISEKHTAVQDLGILANCDHVILSLGTFGWWGGLLSGGEVVYNGDEFDMNHKINKGKVVKTDYYPPEWIQLSAAPVAEKSQWETYLPASNSKNDYCPKKGSAGALWIRQQYSNIPKKNTCKTQKRIGGKGDGGKIVCLDAMEKDNCVVYSLGSRLDFSFENDVVTQLGCEVHTFDCTVGSPSDTPSGVSFHPWCIGGSDTKKRISSDLGHGGEIGQYYTLETIMSMLHHDKINLLKMDIERHEFDVFRTLRTFPDQIVFETHLHNAYDMFGRPVSEQEWSAMWKKLQKYNVFAHEPNPLCLCCCEWSIVLPPKHTNTIVTAYFEMNSKHAKSKYNTWMKNMLSFQDAMVIFTSPDLVSKMESLRAHAMDRTKIISMKLSDTMLVSNYSMDLWKNQFDMDTEKALHKSYELFWLWLSKSWFVTQAIEMNPFSSDVFVWSDIGCFRDTTYNGKKWLQKTNIIPDSAILFAAWTQPQKQRSHWIEKTNYPPFSKSGGLFLAGAQFAGYVKTWEMFHASFLKTLEGYVVRGLFFGDDQAVMQSTCLQNPSLCTFVTPDKVHGSKWFGLQDALHSGGKLYYRDNALLFWLPSPSIKRPKRRGLLCTLVKDEPEQLVQTWVKHHENLGFDVVVYDHGSTNRVTSSVQMIPFTQNALPCTQSEDSERCSKLKKCQQWMAATSTKDHGFAVCQVAAYADCLERYGADYEWFGNWDIDEYVFRTNQKDISPPDFWSLVESLGDSIQLQCLKFGPRRIDTTTFEGDPLKHLWRAPYKHLGEEINCHARVCENVGSEKTLTRISAIQSVLVHKHVLKSGTLRPWMDVTGIQCNHYAFRSKNYVAQKSKKNKNAFLNTQLKTSVFDKTGWFNSMYDDGFGRAQTPEIPHICVAFLSCKRLSYLKQTYAGVRQLVQNENTFKFTFSIVDNGSDDETKKWIHEQSFDHAILLDRNVGIAKAMDMLWASCGDAPYILNVEDDWSFNKKSIRGVLKESVSILDTHSDVLEVWLRSHGRGFQFMPGKTKSINNQIQRRLPVVAAKPLNYYTAWSSKSQFPWWGSYTNGATLKHAKRLKRVGPMSQKSCGDEGNCESEFASKITHLGLKSARLCWNNDSCEKSWNNEPENKVMFEHRGYKRSPGHMETTTEMPKQDKNKQQRQHMTPQTDDIGWIRFNGGDWPRISKHDIYKSIHCTFPKNLQLHLLHGYYLCADGTKSSHSHLPVPSFAATNMVQDSLEELKLLDELASENNIPYSLHAGSLLSFSRAQIYNVSDVIPWDDDVDLMIDKRFQPIILKAFMDGEHVAPISKDWTTKKVRGFFMLTRSNVAPNKSFWFKIKVKNKFYSNDLGGLDIVFVEEKNGNYLKMKGPNTNWKDLSQTGHMPNIPRFDNIIRRPLGNATTYAFDLSIAEPWLIKTYGKNWRWPIFPDLQKYCKSQSNLKTYVK